MSNNKHKYGCPECGHSLSAMHEPDQGTAYWCIGRLEDGSRCGYSRFDPIDTVEKIGSTQYEYLRYKMGL